MNSNYENFEYIVAKTKCGKDNGNAILIDETHVITVKHCVKEAYKNNEKIYIYFIRNKDNVSEAEAVIDPMFNKGEDELVLLTLTNNKMKREVKFGIKKIMPYETANVFGYNANFSADGKWLKLSSANGAIPNEELKQDLLFDVEKDKQKDYSGLSGSPIIQGNYIVGIVSQEILEKGESIGIYGFSTFYTQNFFEKYNIQLQEVVCQKISNEQNRISIGAFNGLNNPISFAAEVEEYQTEIHDIYIDRLNKISNMHRSGRVNQAWDELKTAITKMYNKQTISKQIKSEYIMKMAIWYLEDRNDLIKAQAKIKIAKELYPQLDNTVFNALFQAKSNRNSNPEDLIDNLDTTYKLNIYLQICINNNKIEKAISMYDKKCGIIEEDSTTLYLLSIIEVKQRNFVDAMNYIEKAINLDDNISIYHLTKAIIYYWMSIPEDIYITNDFYPVMFTNGLLHLDKVELDRINKSNEECRIAYNLANSTENLEQEEFVLGLWINILSIDVSLHNQILVPIELLQKKNSYNVSLLLYVIHTKMDFCNNISFEELESVLKESNSKIGYIIVLVELCLLKNDNKRAKQYLHEYKSLFYSSEYIVYWYEYIAKLEDDKAKLNSYESEILVNDKLDNIDQKRMQCLFIQRDAEREDELESNLQEIYKATNKRLDLLNLISFYKKTKKWSSMQGYSKELTEKFKDIYGIISLIQSQIELEEYDEALKQIENITIGDYPIIKNQIYEYKMIVFEKKCLYDKAISLGLELLAGTYTEQLVIKLSFLYVNNGQEDQALSILLQAEENKLLSVPIFQRISILYLIDKPKDSWRYAEKAIDLSNHDPEVILWATNIANRTGRSDKAALYYHELLTSNSKHQMLMVKSIDEVIELINASNKTSQESMSMLNAGKISSHIYVDRYQGNLTFAEYFYLQWEQKDLLPLEFGAHNYRNGDLNINIRRIGIDYSSCLLLYETKVFDVLVDYVDTIYISGELLGVMSEELRNIQIHQKEIILDKYVLLQKIEQIDISKVDDEQILCEEKPRDVEYELDSLYSNTAQANNMLWLRQERNNSSVRLVEIVKVLYKNRKVSNNIYELYADNSTEVREEVIAYLTINKPNILVDVNTIDELNKHSILEIVHENFKLAVLTSDVRSIENQYSEMKQKDLICKKLRDVKNYLLDLKEKGKLSFLPINDYKEDSTYCRLLISLMQGAERRNIPICVDDRFITSYSSIGQVPIYNILDIIKILYLAQKMTLEEFCNYNKILYQANIQYVLPEASYMLAAFDRTDIDEINGTMKESDMLTVVRKLLAKSLSEASKLSRELLKHVRIPEFEYYVFNLQTKSLEIIREIWQSNMDIGKKIFASQWMLFHFSQFAYDYDNCIKEQERINIKSIELADFIITGFLLRIDKNVEQYYKWLFGWINIYLNKKETLKTKVLSYTKEFITSYLMQSEKQSDKREARLIRVLFATGIHYMPDEFKLYILSDAYIDNLYNSIYSVISITIAPNQLVPVDTFKKWENEILACGEKIPVQKEYKNVCYEIYWEYIVPLWPGVVIKYYKDGAQNVKRIRLDYGIRLRNKSCVLRKSDFKSIENYLDNMEVSKQYLGLLHPNLYEKSSNEIINLLLLSESFEKEMLKKGVMNLWIGENETMKFIIPRSTEYFRNLFDYDKDRELSQEVLPDKLAMVPIHLGISSNQICLNNNPVRGLREVGVLLDNEYDSVRFIELITTIFSFVDEENNIYGKLFILLLKSVWIYFKQDSVYSLEPEENLIIWSYIWTDKAMSCIYELSQKQDLNIIDYVNNLEQKLNIDIGMDHFWHSIENEDVLSPNYMNLFKLCVTGTMSLCRMHKKKLEQNDLRYLLVNIVTIMQKFLVNGVYYREAEFSHNKDKNNFNTIFCENIYSLFVELSTELVDIDKDSVAQEFIANPYSRIISNLLKIKELPEIGMSELAYLFIITREKMSESQVKEIEQIIDRQVLETKIEINSNRYRLLSHIVTSLSDTFQDRYVLYEYQRIREELHNTPKLWEQLLDLVDEIAPLSTCEQYLAFYEQCIDEMAAPVDLRIVERIGWLQISYPIEYEERVRKLRIKFELKA